MLVLLLLHLLFFPLIVGAKADDQNHSGPITSIYTKSNRHQKNQPSFLHYKKNKYTNNNNNHNINDNNQKQKEKQSECNRPQSAMPPTSVQSVYQSATSTSNQLYNTGPLPSIDYDNASSNPNSLPCSYHTNNIFTKDDEEEKTEIVKETEKEEKIEKVTETARSTLPSSAPKLIFQSNASLPQLPPYLPASSFTSLSKERDSTAPSSSVSPSSSTSTLISGYSKLSSSSPSDMLILDIGVTEEANPRWRPTMEDGHVISVGLGAEASTASSVCSDENEKGSSPSFSDLVGYFAVYDGHGGRDTVDYLVSHLHQLFSVQLGRGVSPLQALHSSFLAIDQSMAYLPPYQHTGSTVAAAFIRWNPDNNPGIERELFVSNVGDARVVLAVEVMNGENHENCYFKAVRLSRDHCPTTPREIARVTAAGGRVSAGRVGGQLAVSRALGDHFLKKSGVSPVPTQHHLLLTQAHKFLIIACDGLFDVLTDQECVDAIQGMNNAKK